MAQTIQFPMAKAKKKNPGRVWSARLDRPLEARLIKWAEFYGLLDENGEPMQTSIIRQFLSMHLARPGTPQEVPRSDAA